MSNHLDSPEPLPLLSVAAVLSGAGEVPEPAVHVRWFTDPLSAWCWGSAPAFLQLAENFGGLLTVEYRMVGLIKSLEELQGAPGAFRRTDQVAMQWEEVAHFTGMPLDSEIWLDRPPASSWPACAAVRAALAQDGASGQSYLRRLREAALCEGRDVADADLLCSIAAAVGLDSKRLGDDLESGAAGEAFNEDLLLAADTGAVTAPTFVLFGPAGMIEVRGARPFEDLVAAVEQVYGEPVPIVADPAAVPDRQAYAAALAEARGSLTAAELAALLELDRSTAADLLDRMSSAGLLRRVASGHGALYRAVG